MEKECQEKLNVIYYGIMNYWQEIEVNDPNSIFYTEKIIEKEFKQLCPRAGETTLKVLKAIKFSIIEKGKCYYTERELAKHFKVKRQTINKILKMIAKTLNTEFIKIPTNNVVKAKCKSKSPYKCILIPPKLYKSIQLLLQIERLKSTKIDKNFINNFNGLEDDSTLKNNQSNSFLQNNNKCNNFNELEDGSTSLEGGSTSSNFTKDFKHLKTLPIYNTLYTCIQYQYSSSKKQVLSSFKEHLRCSSKESKTCIAGRKNRPANNNFLFSLTKDETAMKHKLRTKLNFVINFDSYGLKPYKFLNHVEVHQELFKWLNILIENNVAPKIIQTKMFLKVWNNFGNKRFIRHHINPKSTTFKQICIALTYRMWSENLSIESIEKSIENFNTLANNQGHLLYVKKLDCLKHFFWNSKLYGQKDYFKLSILDEHCVLPEYYCKQLPPDKSFEVVRKLFGYIFYKEKPNTGKKEFKKYYKLFIDFTNEMIENHRTKKMCKFDEYDTSLEGFEEYIFSYFSYCYRMIKNSENPFAWKTYNILDMHSNFVLWLSNQRGWEGFMEDKNLEELEDTSEEPTKKLKKYKLQVKSS